MRCVPCHPHSIMLCHSHKRRRLDYYYYAILKCIYAALLRYMSALNTIYTGTDRGSGRNREKKEFKQRAKRRRRRRFRVFTFLIMFQKYAEPKVDIRFLNLFFWFRLFHFDSVFLSCTLPLMHFSFIATSPKANLMLLLLLLCRLVAFCVTIWPQITYSKTYRVNCWLSKIMFSAVLLHSNS